jgi:hypothetical protein
VSGPSSQNPGPVLSGWYEAYCLRAKVRRGYVEVDAPSRHNAAPLNTTVNSGLPKGYSKSCALNVIYGKFDDSGHLEMDWYLLLDQTSETVVVVAVPGPVGVDSAAVQADFAEKLVLVRDLLGVLLPPT